MSNDQGTNNNKTIKSVIDRMIVFNLINWIELGSSQITGALPLKKNHYLISFFDLRFEVFLIIGLPFESSSSLQFTHICDHPFVGSQERFGRFQCLIGVLTGGQQFGCSLSHLDLEVNLLLQIIFLLKYTINKNI